LNDLDVPGIGTFIGVAEVEGVVNAEDGDEVAAVEAGFGAAKTGGVVAGVLGL
jgi:hypothetical protein